MHEFALAQDIVNTIRKEVTEDLEKILAINIDVGAFSGVVVDSLDFGLKAILPEGSNGRIKININTVPTIAVCECGHQYHLQDIFENCPACHAYDRKLISGTDITIKSVEIDEPDDVNPLASSNPGHGADPPDDHIAESRKILAIMAHEIKAPLSAISSLLSVIDKGYVTDLEKSKELVSRAKRRAEILIKMLDDILDYAMLSNKTSMKRERLDIISVVDESISMMKPYADQRNVRVVDSRACQGVKYVYGNYTFLLRVFNNLIMNAIKYNKEGGKIQFICREIKEEERMIVKVRDTGIGISEEDLQHVFNIFKRGETARKNIDGSLGLGLSLVKQIVEDHEGSIDISSKVNVGTTVTVSLPLLK
jgi:hydrogenase nickel insertion protein HypA